MENAAAADSSQSNISRIYISKDNLFKPINKKLTAKVILNWLQKLFKQTITKDNENNALNNKNTNEMLHNRKAHKIQQSIKQTIWLNKSIC